MVVPKSLPYWVLEATHPYNKVTIIEYFHDGELAVVEGLVKVPKERPDWAQRLLNDGYRFMDGETPGDFNGAAI